MQLLTLTLFALSAGALPHSATTTSSGLPSASTGLSPCQPHNGTEHHNGTQHDACQDDAQEIAALQEIAIADELASVLNITCQPHSDANGRVCYIDPAILPDIAGLLNITTAPQNETRLQKRKTLNNTEVVEEFRTADELSILLGQTCPEPNATHPNPCPLTPQQEAYVKEIAAIWNLTHPHHPSPIKIQSRSSEQHNAALDSPTPDATVPYNATTNPFNITLPANVGAPLTSTNTTQHPHKAPSHSPDKLEARSHYGWIGSFESDTCAGDPTGPRPKLYSNCVPFSPSTDTVGISWGSWPIGLSTLNVYESNDCSGAPFFVAWNSPQNIMGPGSCIDVGALGKEVRSVMNSF